MEARSRGPSLRSRRAELPLYACKGEKPRLCYAQRARPTQEGLRSRSMALGLTLEALVCHPHFSSRYRGIDTVTGPQHGRTEQGRRFSPLQSGAGRAGPSSVRTSCSRGLLLMPFVLTECYPMTLTERELPTLLPAGRRGGSLGIPCLSRANSILGVVTISRLRVNRPSSRYFFGDAVSRTSTLCPWSPVLAPAVFHQTLSTRPDPAIARH